MNAIGFSANKLVLGLAVLALAVAGCTTKTAARQQAQTAYFSGQTQALQTQLAAQKPAPAPGNTVAILGPVKVAALAWTPDLTLARTIFAAEYIPAGEPSQITIVRTGQEIPVNPAVLLNGGDIPVLPGDVVELKK